MSESPEQDIVHELKLVNEKLARQNSSRHILFTGVIYGIGFFKRLRSAYSGHW